MAVYQKIEVGSSKIAVPAQKLIAGTKLPFDVYTEDNSGYRLLFIRGSAFNSAAGSALLQKKITEVYISAEDQGTLDKYLSGEQPETKAPLKINPQLFQEYSHNKKHYFQIERKLLVAGTKIRFSIFVMNSMVITPLIEAEEYSPCRVDRAALETTGDLLIKTEDIPSYHDYVNSILDSEKAGSLEKAAAVKENMKVAIKDLFVNPRDRGKIQESQILVSNMVACVLENTGAAKELAALMSSDYYTYNHSVNVAVMAIGLGAEINMDRSELEELGLGALLHDIGKNAVPNYIINKQGKLNYNEYRIMQSHVIEGSNILAANFDVSGKSLYALLQHHEKISGKGYPFQLSGGRIKPFGKITAIADCFDALTTHKPYRAAYAPFQALSMITKETGDYDPELLTSFIKMLAKQ